MLINSQPLYQLSYSGLRPATNKRPTIGHRFYTAPGRLLRGGRRYSGRFTLIAAVIAWATPTGSSTPTTILA